MSNAYNKTLNAVADEINSISANLRYDIGVQILYTGLLVDKYVNMKARKYNLNRNRVDTLHALILHGGRLKPSDLSRMLFRSRQVITQTIGILERDKLVHRAITNQDRRVREVVITREGLDAAKASIQLALEITNSGMPQLSNEEIDTLRTILKKIRKHIIVEVSPHHSSRLNTPSRW
jgi:DNA-binding MarR family transcriptional regulator